MNIRIFDSLPDLVQAAARTIEQRIATVERPVIGISGGSTPKPLYEILGKEAPSKPITWVLVDERYVPPDDPQSNARMIRETLHPENFLRWKTERNDPELTVAEFERDWRALVIDRLDIVILGVGDDGHTASLFPGTNVLEVTDRVATSVFVPRLNQWRVTLTLPVIRAAALRIVLVSGESKAKIVRDARAGVDHPIVRATSGVETWWLIDGAAARSVE